MLKKDLVLLYRRYFSPRNFLKTLRHGLKKKKSCKTYFAISESCSLPSLLESNTWSWKKKRWKNEMRQHTKCMGEGREGRGGRGNSWRRKERLGIISPKVSFMIKPDLTRFQCKFLWKFPKCGKLSRSESKIIMNQGITKLWLLIQMWRHLMDLILECAENLTILLTKARSTRKK